MSAHVFVVVPEEGSQQGIVIGKNSNRPPKEVQELVYERDGPSQVKCTYKTLEAGASTMDVILSKPATMWGCELGANSSVVGATVDLNSAPPTGLIPQDILRLALERCSGAQQAVERIGELIGEHGEDEPSAYLVADKAEVWYVEALGRAWVAQQLPPGPSVFPPARHMPHGYSKSAANLEDLAKDKGWNGEGTVPWNVIFIKDSDDDKQTSENEIICKHFKDISDFGVREMTQVLRDEDLRIARDAQDATPTAASQVCVLPAVRPSCHWFTATPDPTLSVFKPFFFTQHPCASALTRSPLHGDGKHALYRLHEAAMARGEDKVLSLLHQMEVDCFNEVSTFMFDGPPHNELAEVQELFKDCVEAEVKFYK